MAQIKTFDDLIDCEPTLKLGELIKLFMLGNDDKIYINIQRGCDEILYTDIRIIDPALIKYYDCYIEELIDPCDNNTLLTLVIKTEVTDGQ